MKPLGLTIFALALCACGPSFPDARPLPPGKGFGGLWDSNWGQMTLRQRGNSVNGRYSGFRNGSISGTVKGDLLHFRWNQEESRQSGRAYLQMTPDGDRLEGRWGYQRDAFKGGRWWATRVVK